MSNAQLDEETPLLRPRPDEQRKEDPPFPWGQFWILIILLFAEPMTYQVIAPFAPQLVRDMGVTHGDEEKVGYYVGLMYSLFFAAEASTVLHWSTLSDRIGRKPLIITGLLGNAISMCTLGLSKTYTHAVIARSLNGALNGNIGVMKGHFSNIFPPSQVAQAISYLPIAWTTGALIGPFIGGAFVYPTEKYPGLFGSFDFLRKYPYFLPCAISALYALIAATIAFFFLKESLSSPVTLVELLRSWWSSSPPQPSHSQGNNPDVDDDENMLIESPTSTIEIQGQSLSQSTKVDAERPLPLRQLLTRDLIIAGGNFAMLSVVDIIYRAILPVFLATPLHLGGLDMSPSRIATVLSVHGVASGFFEIFFFARVVKAIGEKRTYLFGVSMCIGEFMLFPFISYIAAGTGSNSQAVWTVLCLQLVFSAASNLAYGAGFIFVTASSPNKASLASVNGLCQTVVSWFRTVGPFAATSLYSYSLKNRSWTVYWVLDVLSILSVVLGCLLPAQPWKDET